MFSFIKNFTDYGPKSFKGKTPKEILGMNSSKVPVDFFTDAYTQAHLQEFNDADLTDEQENAIELLSDLKRKEEIIKNCYNKRKRRTQKQQAQADQGPTQTEAQSDDEEPMQGPMPGQGQGPMQAEQGQAQAEQGQAQQAPAEGNVSPGDQRPLMGGGRRRKQTKKAKLSKKGKKSKHSKKHKKPSKKSKRVRFSV